MKKISIVINKNWETEPALSAMASATIRPKGMPFPNLLNSPKDGNNSMTVPRACYQLAGATPLQVNVWCLQDLMDPAQSSSSSAEKYRVLPPVLANDAPDLVIAVGTAAFPDPMYSYNGKVFIGSQFFMHNGNDHNPKSNFTAGPFDTLIPSNADPALFALLTPAWCAASTLNFLPVPNLPQTPSLQASHDYVSIGDVNITDYTQYPVTDPASVNAFNSLQMPFTAPSLETTHGIIRISTGAPTIFVSAIVNRMGKLGMEGTVTQNYAGAFNAGVTLANLLLLLNQTTTPDF